MTLQVEEATLPNSKSVEQSSRTRSGKRQMAVKDEESTSEEAQANGDATEDQLQVSHCLEYHVYANKTQYLISAGKIHVLGLFIMYLNVECDDL